MEAKIVGLKKASHCWWFDSHNSTKRSPWLQSALSEEAPQFETMLMAAGEEIEGNGGNIDAKLTVTFSSTAVAGATVEDKINMIEVPTKNYKSNRASYSIGDRQMETNNPELQHQNDSKLMKNDKSSAKPVIEGLEICSRDTMKLTKSPLDCSHSNEYDNCHNECIETIAQFETDHPNIDDHEIIVLYDMIVGDVAKLKSQVERLKVKNKTMNAELKKKDEEKWHVIMQLSLAVEILKEENVNLKRFIKALKKCDNIFELKKLKDGFSGTGKLFGVTLQFQPSLVAL